MASTHPSIQLSFSSCLSRVWSRWQHPKQLSDIPLYYIKWFYFTNFVTKNGCLLPLSVYTVSLQPITHSSAHWSCWVQFTVLDYHLADTMGTRHLFLLLLSLLLLIILPYLYIYQFNTLFYLFSMCGCRKKGRRNSGIQFFLYSDHHYRTYNNQQSACDT